MVFSLAFLAISGVAQAALEIREIKCIDKILESAKVMDVAPKKAEEKGAKLAKKAAKKPASKKTDKSKWPVRHLFSPHPRGDEKIKVVITGQTRYNLEKFTRPLI